MKAIARIEMSVVFTVKEEGVDDLKTLSLLSRIERNGFEVLREKVLGNLDGGQFSGRAIIREVKFEPEEPKPTEEEET